MSHINAPAGAQVLTLESVEGLASGDLVVVTRPSTAAWIAALKMNNIPGKYANMRLTWMDRSRNVVWDRRIVSIEREKKQIMLDAPITTALETQYGLGTVAKVTDRFPITQVGIEDVALESAVDPSRPLDEDHSWIALALDGVEDGWVRNVTARHFAGSAVRIGPRARRITVETCRSEAPVSEVGGWRRISFLVEGQQVLLRDCYSESGVADFAVGLCAGGPDVFLDCRSKGSLGASGSLESWASGALFERVKIGGAALRLVYDTNRVQGAGWTAANSVIWNCQATSLEAVGPEGASNFVVESKATLYEVALKARGCKLPPETKVARADLAKVPVFKWNDSAPAPAAPAVHALKIVGGRYVVDDHLLWGGQIGEGWWRGQATPGSAPTASGPELTRWVPGRVGPSLTEDLPALGARMRDQGTPFISTLPGLWYDRRRDEHSVTAREDANVWAPFSEMPWARSGKGTAFDGLSKFDLTKYNPWYYSRLREFARVAATNGLVLYHAMYNTHNVLEILPHYVDYPWRPTNNVNRTGLSDMPPEEPGRVHLGNEFYSTENPFLRELHRNFILHELDELGSEPNVILSLAFQFVGPLAFQQFFQDTVASWEKAHGRKVRLIIQTTKDITDAILTDPVRSQQIAAVDLRYWQYRPDGSLWEPQGGRNRAFREMVRETFPENGDSPPGTTPEQAYRQVREYRDKYPQFALLAWHNDAGPLVSLMAGAAQVLGAGSARSLDNWIRAELGLVLMTMSPRDNLVSGSSGAAWCMADESMRRVLLYSTAGATLTLDADLPAKAYAGTWVNPATAKTQALASAGPWIKGASISKPDENAWLLSLRAD